MTLRSRQPNPKDPDAELEMQALLRLRSDTSYLLMQRTLMLEAALEQAQLRPEQLQPAGAFGPVTAAAPSALPAPAAPTAPQSPSAAPIAGPAGFLRNATAMGAGVLGGSLLPEGIESLRHGGRRWAGGMTQAPVEVFETNNFIQPIDRGGRSDTLADLDGPTRIDDAALDLDIDSWT